ncbi:MAG TPA: nucleotidyltransferase domain-containing protein [Terriglobia bacterium]|nr:nucleotidyltransferase domain-containing protein [Terriglobia bacterium]
MCRRFGVDRGNLVKKLKEFEKEGILTSEWRGNQRYYSLNHSFPLIREYQRIFSKTVGLEESLKKVIGEVTGIKRAVLFGSYAEDRMDLSSDIDLLVVGDHDTLELQKKISQFQKTIDREINVVSMGTKEYERKQKADALLRSIRHKKSIPLV